MWRTGYSILLYLLWPLIAVRLLWRARRNPAYLRRWRERFTAGVSMSVRPRLWVHAVSVGEVVAASPLIKALFARFPDHAVLVTTTTPTGSAEVQRRFGDRVEHRYLPVDLPHLAGAVVRRINPHLLLVMETELWPNLYAACRREGVPVMLVNARLSERSLGGYRRVRPLVAQALRSVTALAARSEEDARRFLALGADAARLRVTGNLKYDLPAPSDTVRSAASNPGEARPVWIAASTHDGEDEQVLAAHAALRKHMPDALLILVPRHPERFDAVARLCGKSGFAVARRSRDEVPDAATAVWLGDTMGELPDLFPLAQVAFLGGSLVPTGGHNPLEAAVHHVPVLTGPHVFNFREVFDGLVGAGGARVVADADALADVLRAWLGDDDERQRRGAAADGVVEANRGALDSVVAWVEEILARRTTTEI
ncbi:3-deoxy-D-manno-octulosonic acid transferase [Thioalkalivibrio denitrificans]|uniref:3-deoxy-D-manno-octulosonic acid transferase n=1 Tax=Thioalkalivibrio denitrificans TaxID=108003 RepID=A0A1V3NF50_9GAMM|nr:lipid IV(A) 3-deoxy-D-manno-octulosonic acid transferase [Thioalkalivibrio denitrificans]OOG23406.1 3-deoxy-D-manno-octulosonic acid transferase [Thioalkalivibrio denitrificans]